MDTGETAARSGTGECRASTGAPVEIAQGREGSWALDADETRVVPGSTLPITSVSYRDRAGWIASLGAAALAHIGLLVALAWAPPVLLVGAGGRDLEASSVEVTLLPAVAFESLRAASELSTAAARIETRAGQLLETSSTRTTAQPTAQEPVQQTHTDATAEGMQEPAPKTPPGTDVARANDAAAPTPVGGSVARGAHSEPTSAAATVVASAGQVAAYASSIAEALGRTRPSRHAPDRGTVRVVFAIGEDGVLADIQIKATSGRPSLDALAVVAIRQTRFPPPPPGMTPTQRTYEVPYHFR